MNKWTVFSEDKLIFAKMTISLSDRDENTVGGGENAGYKHFLLFQQFSKAFFLRVFKSRDCLVKS